FVGTLEPRVSSGWLGIGQRIPKVGDLSINFRRNCRELVTESKIQSQIGASLVVILEIKSEQVLTPTADAIASGNVVIKLSSSSSQKIIERVEEILPAVHAG